MLHGKPHALLGRLARRDRTAELPQILRQLVRRKRARICRSDGDKLLCVPRNVAVHAVEVLVAQHAGQHRQLPSGQIVLNILDERLDALRIVAAVNDEHRLSAHQLETARPADGLDALADIFVGDPPAALLQYARRGQRDCCVVQLMFAQQRKLQALEVFPVEHLSLERMRQQLQRIEVRLVQRHAELLAALLEHSLDRRLLAVDHGVATGLDDPGLGRGDLLQRIAQHLGVVESDVADHSRLRRQDHVRRVKFAAHADLADHDVAVLAGKILEAERRHHLKLRRPLEDGVGHGLDVLGQLADILVGDLLAVDLNALVEADQIRRGIQAGPVACLAQDGRDHRAGRALAVGAGHMDKFALPLGMAHHVEQGADALQPGDAPLPADLVNIMQSFVKSHKIAFCLC